MAGGSVIGALRVVLGMDTANFETAAQRAPKTAASMSAKISGSFRGAERAALSLTDALGALGGALALKELAGAAQRAFDYADAIQDLSDRTGASTKLIQEFRYAAQLSGSSVEVADEALGKFAKTLGLAQSGSDQQVKLFRELGVTSSDFDTALRQTIAGISKLPTVQQRNATALQLMGKSAATLTGLLGQGVDGFDDLAAAAHRLGIVLSDDVIRNAGGANDKLDTLKMILNAQFANAVTQNANSIVALADGVTKLTSALVKFMSENPREALGIIGALAGSRAGLPGAAIGAFGGFVAGDKLARNAADQNTDLSFRSKALRDSIAAYRNTARAQKQGGLITIRKRSGDGPQDMVGAAKEFQRQKALYSAAIAAARGRKATDAEGQLRKTGNAEDAAAAKKAEADRKHAAAEAKRMADKEARDEDRFQDQLARERSEQLRSEAELAVTQDERVNAEQAMLDADKKARLGEIARDRDLTAEQKAQMSGLIEETAVLKSRLLHRRDQEELARQELEHQERVSADASDLLDAQAGLARTAKERRDLELQLLDLQFKQLKLAQQAIVDSALSTPQEKTDATARLAVLDKLKAFAQQRAERDNAGPLGQYLDSMPRNAAELNEAYQAVATDGLKNLNDGLAEAIMGSKSLTSVFSDMASSIIADLARIAVQQMIIKPLAQRLFGGSEGTGSSSGGGIFALLGNLMGKRGGGSYTSPFAGAGLGPLPFVPDSSGLPKLATGGFFNVGGRSGIDRNVLSVNGIPRAMVGANERVHVNPANDRGGTATVVLAVEEGALFRPTVRSEAGDVSIRTVGAAGRAQATRARQTLR
ncbi:hypothetical protein MOP88_13910 [Sphingomonas sp. WKB10]|nr:hypothetical protein [Sphingomonas sp. WKB10]